MKPYFALTSEPVQAKYQIEYFPTVILIVNGKERQRWVMEYDLEKYRSVINAVLAEPPSAVTGDLLPPASR